MCGKDIWIQCQKKPCKIIYPSVPSVTIPVPHLDELSQPDFHELPSDDVLQESFHSLMPMHYERPEGEDKDIEHSPENSSDSDDTVNDTGFDSIPAISLTSLMAQPECFDQSELNDIVRDLGLSKELVELLASRLSERHVLKLGTNISFYRHRDMEFRRYFPELDVFVTCIGIRRPLSGLGILSYNPDEWRLFIDSSKRSLRCVLLHNVIPCQSKKTMKP